MWGTDSIAFGLRTKAARQRTDREQHWTQSGDPIATLPRLPVLTIGRALLRVSDGWESELIGGGRVLRSVLVVALMVLSLLGAERPSLAEGGVEQRIADFWQRIDSKAPSELLAAADLGQWGLNVIERDATARITVFDFRASTGAMQAAMERVRQVTSVAPAAPGVEARIAEFWKRLDAMQSGDHLASADLGQWALNVTQRDPNARITVVDFRASTAAMQGAIERAVRLPSVAPAPGPAPVQPPAAPGAFDPGFYVGKGDAFNCTDFVSQAAAQAVLRADATDPNRLDSDRDGIACESNRSPKDLIPVRR